MTISAGPILGIEWRKVRRAPVASIAAAAVLCVVSLASIGGYAAAVHSPGSGLGRKAATMIVGAGWDSYTGLTAVGLGVAMMLGAGVVVSWAVGREFTDGTIVGLFAVPVRRGRVALAKVAACLGWGAVVSAAQAGVSALAGVLLGLPPAGAAGCCLTLIVLGLVITVGVLPVAWVATVGRGYLAGIGATLALVVVTNLAAGFGLGGDLPWALPVLWATPGSGLTVLALGPAVAVGLIGAWATRAAWDRLQLGRR